MSVGAAVFDWRCRRALRVLELQRRRTLEVDLACVRSEADRLDLTALLDTCDDDQTSEVREILMRHVGRADQVRHG